MSQPAIEVKNLSKVYNINHEQKAAAGTHTLRDTLLNAVKKPLSVVIGGKLDQEKFWALKDINLEVNKGDVIGLIGRNGSGKSTLLKVLSRIVDPTEGEVFMRGKVASLLEVGTGFHPELTGRENIFFNGAILGMSQREIRAKFDEIVEFSEVEKFLDTPVKFYSSGMYVRLAFSVAAHLDPDILIVDEVLAVGDAAFQKKCLGKIKDVAGSGRTVLFVSHNMSTVQSLCNKVALLEKGVIKAIGETGAVIDLYSSAVVASGPIISKNDPSRIGKILSLGINSENKRNGMSEDLQFELTYQINEEITNAIITCDFYSVDGVPIMATTDVDSSLRDYHGTRKPGIYLSTVKIPPHTFTDKTFYVVGTIQVPGRDAIDSTGEFYFEVAPDNGFKRSEVVPGSHFGYMAALIPWETEKLK